MSTASRETVAKAIHISCVAASEAARQVAQLRHHVVSRVAADAALCDAVAASRPLRPPSRSVGPSPSPAAARALQRDLRLGIVPVLSRRARK